MHPKLYWISECFPGRLPITARPRGGDWLDDDVQGWRRAGIDTILSLLTLPEVEDLRLDQESKAAANQGIQFLSLPIEDRGVPESSSRVLKVISELSDDLRRGRSVALHCRQGIGRSGMIAAALLVAVGSSADDTLAEVSHARGVPVPETTEQRDWVRKFARRETPAGSALFRGR